MKIQKYPKLILGSDLFLRDSFRKQIGIGLNDFIYDSMYCSIKSGAKGIDVNIDSPLVYNSFKRIKQEQPDIVGIGDPNMNCGVFYDNNPLLERKNELISYIVNDLFSSSERNSVLSSSNEYKQYFFTKTFEISNFDPKKIRFDEDEWIKRLNKLSDCCDYCLFGAEIADWLICIGRNDVIEFQAKTIQEYGMKPISICHWTGKSLPYLESIDGVFGHWILANKECQFPNSIEPILSSKKVLTGFRMLRGLTKYYSVAEALNFAGGKLGVNNFVIGASVDLKETSKLFEEFNSSVNKENDILTSKSKCDIIK